MMVFLDTGVLGFLTNPGNATESVECKLWLRELVSRGAEVRVPEIADYELRRELVRIESLKALERLDDIGRAVGFLPLSTAAMRTAATYWAEARNAGVPSAGEHALDGDVILAAQASTADHHGHDPIVATTNVKHLEKFLTARLWRDIRTP